MNLVSHEFRKWINPVKAKRAIGAGMAVLQVAINPLLRVWLLDPKRHQMKHLDEDFHLVRDQGVGCP